MDSHATFNYLRILPSSDDDMIVFDLGNFNDDGNPLLRCCDYGTFLPCGYYTRMFLLWWLLPLDMLIGFSMSIFTVSPSWSQGWSWYLYYRRAPHLHWCHYLYTPLSWMWKDSLWIITVLNPIQCCVVRVRICMTSVTIGLPMDWGIPFTSRSTLLQLIHSWFWPLSP